VVDPEASEGALKESRRRTDQITQVVIRHVSAEMAGRPADQVYRVLNARLHAAGVPLDLDQVRQLAESISDARRMAPGT